MDSYPATALRLGAMGDAITRLQQRLNATGAHLAVDGEFGPATQAAVRAFQTSHGLTADGIAGPLTWAALFSQTRPGDALLARAVAIARTQVGIMEEPPGSNRGPQVDAYLRRVSLDPAAGHYAWCAAFVYWCFDEAARAEGVANPAPKTAGVLDAWRMAGAAKRLRPAKATPALIRPGMVFFIDHGAGKGHMGLITGINAARLATIEGNSNLAGGREGVGVFERTRAIAGINLGFADYTALR